MGINYLCPCTGKHCILYELVDESCVEILNISNPLTQPDVDSFRYPKAGTLFFIYVLFCDNEKAKIIGISTLSNSKELQQTS